MAVSTVLYPYYYRVDNGDWAKLGHVQKVGKVGKPYEKLEIWNSGWIHTSKIFPTFFITPTISVNIPYKPERYQLLKKLEIWMVVGIQIPIPTEIIFLTYRTRYTLTSTFGKPPFI